MQFSPATAPTHSEVEAIVRAVLQRLRALETASAAVPEASGQVHLEQRLVTLEDLRDHWGTIKSLQVPTRCIITPAAQDELRRRGVELQRINPSAKAGSEHVAKPANSLLVMLPTGSKSELRSLLENQGAEIVEVADDCTVALQTLQNHFAGQHSLCLWSSPRPFAAIRACATVPQVVAVQLSRIEELTLAIAQAQPNVLVLDDRSWTTSGLANLARSWNHNLSRGSGRR